MTRPRPNDGTRRPAGGAADRRLTGGTDTALVEEQVERARRARGHAHLAASARRTLGVQVTVAQRVAHVPAPLFSGIVAVAASVVAVLLRPQRVPRGLSLPLEAALVAVCAAAIVAQARVAQRHPGAVAPGGGLLSAAFLPVAALCSLFVALAGSDAWVATIAAAPLCAAVVALSSHLDALRAAGGEGGRERILRDAGGTAVMIPAALAGASPALAEVPRAGTVLLVSALLVLAATPSRLSARLLVPAIGAGIVTAAGTVLAARAGSPATGATGLLLLWYGLRGLAAVLQTWPRERMAILEYVAVTGGAVALLVTQARG